MVGGYHEIFTSTACYRISRCSCRDCDNYDDGSLYTLQTFENLYGKIKLSLKEDSDNKDTFFTAQDPWTLEIMYQTTRSFGWVS